MTTPLDTSSGLNFQVMADLSANLGQVAQEMKLRREKETRLAQGVHPFMISPNQITLAASAGTLNQPNLYGPQLGNYWDVKCIQATGFSAGTVTVYYNQNGAEEAAIFSTAGVLLVGKGQILLSGNDALIFVAASITGSVTIAMRGIEIAAPLIGDYLM